MGSDLQVGSFAGFALATQAVLLLYFAARRWRPRLADRYGWIAYAFGMVGLPLGVWLIGIGTPLQLYTGPLLFAAWAAYGAWADLLHRIEWRRPIRWSIFGPYVTLYLAGQMFLWWPLWNVWLPGWGVYLVLFMANTALNIFGHFGPIKSRLDRHSESAVSV